MLCRLVTALLLPAFALPPLQAQSRFSADNGTILFVSDAPLEIIQARSKALRGTVEPESKRFAFTVQVRTFQGFNSALQQEHFNENYLESDRFPDATFTGRILDPIDLRKPGSYSVRAKGMLTIHGHAVERILPVTLVSRAGELKASSEFLVPLADHGIHIPRVVHQKIAEEIRVSVNLVLKP